MAVLVDGDQYLRCLVRAVLVALVTDPDTINDGAKNPVRVALVVLNTDMIGQVFLITVKIADVTNTRRAQIHTVTERFVIKSFGKEFLIIVNLVRGGMRKNAKTLIATRS